MFINSRGIYFDRWWNVRKERNFQPTFLLNEIKMERRKLNCQVSTSDQTKSTWKLLGKLHKKRWCHAIEINWFRFKKKEREEKLYFIQSLTTVDTNLNDFDFSISFTCIMCAQVYVCVCVCVNLCSTLDISSPKESDHSMFSIYVNTASLTDSQINRMPYAYSFTSHQRPPQLALPYTLSIYPSYYPPFPIIILTSS